MSKNIVVLSDGTACSGGQGHDTNVYKLFRMLECRTPRQVVYYDPGLGTDWRKITGNAAGMGITRNILEGYRFIFDHFEAGDRLFLFGFSRGAATVTSLTHFIQRFGILPKSRPGLIRRAWRLYRRQNWPAASDFASRHNTLWARVHFLGVWDTVSALGIPTTLGIPFIWLDILLDRIPFFRHRFHRFDLTEVVRHGRHAVAIDEPRRLFRPELWPHSRRWCSTGVTTAKQIWFPGSHSDVGGGYVDSRLSDIALQWMVHEAACLDRGLRLRRRHGVQLEPSPYGSLHDPCARGLARLYCQQPRSWPLGWDRPTIHESVLDRAAWSRDVGIGLEYLPWILRDFGDDSSTEPWSVTSAGDHLGSQAA